MTIFLKIWNGLDENDENVRQVNKAMITGEFLAFSYLPIIAVIGGVLLLNLTNVVHMVLALVATFISIAGIYILLVS